MKQVLVSFLVSMLFAVSTFNADAQNPVKAPAAPTKKSVLVPPTIQAVGGDLVIIDAKGAKGDVKFVYDKTIFSDKRGIVDGKKLFLAMPKYDEPKSYSVTVISWDDKTDDIVTINVAGGIVPDIKPIPKPTPVPSDVIAQLRAEMADGFTKIGARLTALEQNQPTPPPMPTPTAIAKHLTFVAAELTAEAKVVNNDAGLRDMLKNAGIKIHVVPKSGISKQSPGFIEAVTKANNLPCVIIQDENGIVIGHGPMVSVSAVADLAAKFIKR